MMSSSLGGMPRLNRIGGGGSECSMASRWLRHGVSRSTVAFFTLATSAFVFGVEGFGVTTLFADVEAIRSADHRLQLIPENAVWAADYVGHIKLASVQVLYSYNLQLCPPLEYHRYLTGLNLFIHKQRGPLRESRPDNQASPRP
jgi:hypothetical protein